MTDAMSTHKPSFTDEIAQCNHQLDCLLRERFSVSVRVYRTIKALTQLLAVAAGIFAITEGADATTTFLVIGTIVVGPEAIETVITNEQTGGGT